MAPDSISGVVRILYRPSFAVGTERSRSGDSASYVGADFGPTHFVAKLSEGQVQKVYRFVGYDILGKESMVVPVSDKELIRKVIEGIGQ